MRLIGRRKPLEALPDNVAEIAALHSKTFHKKSISFFILKVFAKNYNKSRSAGSL